MQILWLTVLSTLLSGTAFAQQNSGILLEANDAGEQVWAPMPTDSKFENYLPQSFFNFKKKFSTVAQVITPEVENAFDLFVFANVAYQTKGSPGDHIPPQHLKIFRKSRPGQIIFNRDTTGNILAEAPVRGDVPGLDDHFPAFEGLPGLIPSSSGASHFGSDYVDTFSGVFRINTQKSLTRRFQDGMFNALYVDIRYPWGKMSGIAIHGTFKSQYRKLGQQASHGCIRVKQNVSKALYEYSMSEALYDPLLLDFNNTQRLPPVPLANARAGQKVLFVFFYGY